MKRTQLLVLSVLALGLQGVAQANPFPSDAEASYNLQPKSTYADQASDKWAGVEVGFPSDAEAQIAMPAPAPVASRTVARLNLAQASIHNFGQGGIDD